MDLAACRELDRKDPLAVFRNRFDLPHGVIYLDGNSLGALPREVSARLQAVTSAEWGGGLIRSWNSAGWIDAPLRTGDKIARLIGARPGEVAVADSTSVNLFKLIGAAVQARPGRRVVLSDSENFPTDLYIAEGVARMLGAELRLVPRRLLAEELGPTVALLMLTQVDFRTGELLDMAALTAAAHSAGALALWDLSHSAGALPIDLAGAGVDLAVGCGYKFLNGGPGAPAYLHVSTALQDELRSPIQGWLGHRSPFQFAGAYVPAKGVERFLAGTPPILSLAALEVALDLWLEVNLTEVRVKSIRMGELFIELVDKRPELGLILGSPRQAGRRGSQLSFRHPQAYGLIQSLIERGVIGDFRPPDNVRFGLTPLYTRYEDIHDAVGMLAMVIASGDHLDPRWDLRNSVT